MNWRIEGFSLLSAPTQHWNIRAVNDPANTLSSRCQGIWRIDREEEASTPPGTHLTWHDVFVCHPDGSISVYLLSLSPEPDDPADGIYRLESAWKGDTLFYRLPNGIEVALGTFREGRFETAGDNRVRIYRRITAEELLPAYRPLLDTSRSIR
jgi:hypothetical protein